MAFDIIITTAGRAALVNAANTGTLPVQITQIGVSSTAIAANPAMVALTGELKRLSTISGEVVADDTIHVTLRDESADAYGLRSVGLYLSDGTLFALYGQVTPILEKTPASVALLAIDIIFADISAASISFGDTDFTNPPATETVQGVAEIATQAEVNSGTDNTRIVTPLRLAQRLAPITQSIANETTARNSQIAAETSARQSGDANLAALITALTNRSITGRGLATGGGSLAADRVISVAAATVSQLLAGTADNVAITPATFGPIIKSYGQNGYLILALGDPANALCLQWGRFNANPNALTSVFFPVAFSQCWVALTDGTNDTSTNAQDNYPAIRTSSITPTGFQVWSANNQVDTMTFIALGVINLSGGAPTPTPTPTPPPPDDGGGTGGGGGEILP